MKFGFGTKPSDHYQDYLAMVQEAERLGYDFAWVPDQTFYRDPFMVLGAIALSTNHIQLGVGVTNPYTRHPATIARALGTLDEFAPGRAHMGVGAGNRKELLHPLGYDGAHAASLCRETVVLVRRLLSNEVVDFHGQHFQADMVQLDFPVNHKVPCYIAGRGKLVLQAAGAVADGVIIGGLCTTPGIQFALEQLRVGAAQTSRDPRQMEKVAWVTCRVTDDRASTFRELRPVIAHLVGGAPQDVLDALELETAATMRIKRVYARDGISAAAEQVTDECVEAFTVVGNGREIVQRIQALEEAGVTQVAVLMPPGSAAEHVASLRDFADAVFPAFRMRELA